VNKTFPLCLTMLYYCKNCQVFLAYSVHTHINTYIYIQDVLHCNCQTSRACSKGHLEQKTCNKLYFVVTLLSGYILQNLFNSTSDYSEILIMWHLRKVVPRLVVFLFTRKSFIVKQVDYWGIYTKASKSVHQLLW